MTTGLVFVQHVKGVIPKIGLATITAAKELQTAWKLEKLVGLVAGPGAGQAATALRAHGFTEVLFNESSEVETYRAIPFSQMLLAAAQKTSATVFVAAATSLGKDLFGRVTGILKGAQASDILAVNPQGTLQRPMYAGNVIAEVELMGNPRLVTVRTSCFAPAIAGEPVGAASELTVQFDLALAGEVTGYESSGGDRPQLTDAQTIVSGGRAMASSENFEKYIFPLADAFAGAVGASRAAVDSGYAPNDWQVGQTGKIVAPQLYVAVGISGAIQHLAGMKDSKVIVAINKDADAPIFEVADYGLVADLFKAVPELTEAVKKAKSS